MFTVQMTSDLNENSSKNFSTLIIEDINKAVLYSGLVAGEMRLLFTKEIGQAVKEESELALIEKWNTQNENFINRLLLMAKRGNSFLFQE